MRSLVVLLLCAAGAAHAWSDPPAADVRQIMEAAAARQKQAVESMSSGLAAQKNVLQKQTGQTAPGGFFLLPPPAWNSLRPPQPPQSNPVAGADCDPLTRDEVDRLVNAAATREDLHPDVLRGVMRQESAFRPCAVSPKGAMGLMQLMPAIAAQFGVRDPFNPKDNVDAGARLLKQLLKIYDLPTALAAYNAGPGRVNQSGGIPNIPETLDYVQRILSQLPARH